MNLKKIQNLEDLKKIKSDFYGSNGQIIKLQKQIKLAPKEEKKKLGMQLHKIKKEADIFFQKKHQELEKKKIEDRIQNEWIDTSIPVSHVASFHPLTLISNKFREWLIQNGFYETTGSEIETDKYNFERLNIPLNHPARELHDTLYLEDINNIKKEEQLLLRTHNTGFSARELEKHKNKAFSQFSIGNVYRNDKDDNSHSHQFMQLDLVCVGKYSMANLIWLLKNMIFYVLEKKIEIQIRPSYFPFTKPSIEIDIKYNDKWIEVLGAGMLHSKVLDKSGYDNDFNGLAAGIGIDRIAMIKYNIKNIKELYTNDLRFLHLFKGCK